MIAAAVWSVAVLVIVAAAVALWGVVMSFGVAALVVVVAVATLADLVAGVFWR